MLWLDKIFRSKYPLIRQYDQKDCGPAALLSLIKYYGGNTSLPHLRELCNTNLQGTKMLDIIDASKEFGFRAFGATGKYNDLMKVKLPCIAHVVFENVLNHFIVVYKIRKDKIYVADPGDGKSWLSKDEFLGIWQSKAVILFEPPKEISNRKIPRWYDWIFSYLKKESAWIYQSLLLGSIYTLLGLVTAIFVQKLLDDFIPQREYYKIVYSGGFLLGILILKSLAGYLRQRFMIVLNKSINTNINSNFLEHLFKLPKKFFDSRKIGDITARINDALRIQNAVNQIVGNFIIDLFLIIGSLACMFYFSQTLALISLMLVPTYLLVLLLNVKKVRREQNEVMKSYSTVESNYINNLKGIDEIIGFNVGNTYSKITQLLFGNYQEKIKALGFTQSNLSLFAEVFTSLIIVGILAGGALWVIKGKLLIGEVMASYTLLANVIPAVNRFVNTTIVLQETSIASTRLLDMLLVEKENNNGTAGFNLNNSLSIVNGSFSWNGRDKLFTGINMEIKKGKITALWGKSGSGKSTIVKILQRKYNLLSGELLVDEVDSNKIDLNEYRKNIGVVPQDIKLFNGTITENILLGRNNNDIDFIIQRIDELGLTNFYRKFGHGLATIIGEDGRELSGGEKQLLAITRALLENPSVLVIDEGLSGIDVEYEKIIFDVIRDYSTENAVFLITHNLHSIMKSDFVYVLMRGRITEKGKPEEIIIQQGYFNAAWEIKKGMYNNIELAIG